MKTTIIAAAILLAASPAFASTSLLPRLAEVEDAVKNLTPDFQCAPGDKNSCQQVRGRFNAKGEAFATYDYANGHHAQCFWPTQPRGTASYGLCQGGGKAVPVLGVGAGIAILPVDDPRCKDWGSFDTVEYLTCEAAQPQKLVNGN